MPLREGEIVQPTKVSLQLIDKKWPFSGDHRENIAAHWRQLTQRNSAIWNGKVLMAETPAWHDGVLEIRCFEADYASFIAWRDWGWPDRKVFNCFGSALILSNDHCLIYGEMAATTLNEGAVYPPGGSLEPGDVRANGEIDVIGSIHRELYEETGLRVEDAAPTGLWALADGQRVSIAQALRFDCPGDVLAKRLNRWLKDESSPELSRVIALKSDRAWPGNMPGYARGLAEHLLVSALDWR